MQIRHLAVIGIVLLLIAGAAIAWHPTIPPLPQRPTFAQPQIEQGAELAAIGNCAVCHTAAAGQPYAGGRPVKTPFGIVYATNITPDPQTGIGQWSLAAFTRTMRDGIDRTGHNLYPVLPYPHFTQATDQDIAALYAFLMTRAPVAAATPPATIPIPRVLIAGWNLLYLSPGPWHPDQSHNATWNRGAYLTEAIAHCGACHTPHNSLGAEKSSQPLGGGEADDWYAPPLQAESPAQQPWNREALATYLRTGFEAGHSAAAGPMTDVTTQLASIPQPDIDAMATYIAAQMPSTSPQPAAAPHPTGNPIFAGACGGCHGPDAPMTRNGAPSLALSTAINAPTPATVIQVILHGIPWREDHPGPFMPPFASTLTDAQVADLTAWLRRTYSNKGPWPNLPSQVAKLRESS
jgi:mono/diheme cytochrome c family protein